MTAQIRNVVLYVIDSLRFDHVGPMADGNSLTPNLDRLAIDGVRFSNAVAQATWSKPSAAALLTGVYPPALGMHPRSLMKSEKPKAIALPPSIETIASCLARHGFRSNALTSNPFVSERFGMDRGFSFMPDMFQHPSVRRREVLSSGVRHRFGRKRFAAIATGAELNSALFESWQSAANSQFTLLWSMDTHPPLFDRYKIDQLDPDDPAIFNTVASARGQLDTARGLYRRMVQYADEQVGGLVQWLKSKDLYLDSLIVVTADHGESFGGHGIYGHSGFPYDSQIHVPLIIKLPGREYAGHKCDKLVGLIDVFPTIADLYQIPIAQPVNGRSLLPVIGDQAEGHEYLVVHDQTGDGRWEYLGIRSATAKYMRRRRLARGQAGARGIVDTLLGALGIARQKEEAFDLAVDPDETLDVLNTKGTHWDANPPARVFESYLQNVRAFFAAYVGELAVASLDRRVRRRLADLGYVE